MACARQRGLAWLPTSHFATSLSAVFAWLYDSARALAQRMARAEQHVLTWPLAARAGIACATA